MDITKEIVARIKILNRRDPNSKVTDFQVRATRKAIYVVNLKTGIILFFPDNHRRAVEVEELIYD